MNDTDPIAQTQTWLAKAVIGLNLCPFAKAVQARGQIRWVLSAARDERALLTELQCELQRLADTDPELVDTTLIVHPQVLGDFLDYNDFLDLADAALEELDLDGVIQIASFHPHYQFAGSVADDVTNCTNRSPYPTLHLLRETSVERAVEVFGAAAAAAIVERNIQTLRRLGLCNWNALFAR